MLTRVMVLGERFLSQPDLFPARMAGTPAGDRELLIDIAGGPYAVRGLSPGQSETLTRRYGPLCMRVTPPEDAVEVRVFGVDDSEFVDLDLKGKLNDFDFDYTETRIRIAGRRVMAQLRWSPGANAGLWTCIEDGPGFLEIFENCFRVCVAYRLLTLGGALLHSAAISKGGRAWLLFGRSGIGKSTIARRSAELGYGVLSDDLNAVLVRGSAPMAVKMPFSGDMRDHLTHSPVELPIAALGALRQASEIAWSPLSPGRAAAALASCCPFVNRDPFRAADLLTNLEALVSRIPVGLLSMTLEGDFRPILENLDR